MQEFTTGKAKERKIAIYFGQVEIDGPEQPTGNNEDLKQAESSLVVIQDNNEENTQQQNFIAIETAQTPNASKHIVHTRSFELSQISGTPIITTHTQPPLLGGEKQVLIFQDEGQQNDPEALASVDLGPPPMAAGQSNAEEN